MVGACRDGCEPGGALHVCGGIIPASQIQKQPDTCHAYDGRCGHCRGTYYGLKVKVSGRKKLRMSFLRPETFFS